MSSIFEQLQSILKNEKLLIADHQPCFVMALKEASKLRNRRLTEIKNSIHKLAQPVVKLLISNEMWGEEEEEKKPVYNGN